MSGAGNTLSLGETSLAAAPDSPCWLSALFLPSPWSLLLLLPLELASSDELDELSLPELDEFCVSLLSCRAIHVQMSAMHRLTVHRLNSLGCSVVNTVLVLNIEEL